MKGRRVQRLNSLERDLLAAEQAARDLCTDLQSDIEIQERLIAATVIAFDLLQSLRASDPKLGPPPSRQESMAEILGRFRDLQQMTAETGAAWHARVDRVRSQMHMAGHKADPETLVTLIPMAQTLA